ncbi:unnamed protein product [Onchocerca flexuosa]|uniref:Transposase n=1 Tax=Onchocerca flexuosa TaxID=387005 RepID=A0A183HBN0_9BILA|nr:unnamed protein product [Onchocerca flexuosa]
MLGYSPWSASVPDDVKRGRALMQSSSPSVTTNYGESSTRARYKRVNVSLLG